MKSTDRPRRVSDVAGSVGDLPGEQVKVSELVDSEFVINSINERDGDWGPYLAVGITVKDEKFYFFSNHAVLMGKLQKCMGQLPLFATISVRESKSSGMTYFDIG